MVELEGFRAYFGPCGIGYGHVGRCLPIAEELLRRGARVLFSTYREGFDYVKKLRLPLVKSPSIGLSIDETGRVDFKRTSTKTFTAIPKFLMQVNAEIENMRSFKPDIVISDTRLSSVVAAEILGVPTVLILNQFNPIIPRRRRFLNLSKIADSGVLALVGQGWSLSDIILIPDFPPPYTISLNNLKIPKRLENSVRFIGMILPTNPSEGKEARAIRTELDVEEGECLIFAPISGPREERRSLIARLTELFEDLPREYRVVMSLGEVEGGSTLTRKGSLTIIPWIMNRFDYLKACDLVVSRPGHGTIMQSIAFGKPQILIPTPGHTEQHFNAKRAQELGVAKVIDQEALTKKRLLSTITKMPTSKDYSTNLERIREANRTDGVQNAVEEIMRLHRKATS